MKVKYKGNYAGVVPWLGRQVAPGDEIEVSDEQGEKLIATGQFEKKRKIKSKEKPEPIGGEIDG